MGSKQTALSCAAVLAVFLAGSAALADVVGRASVTDGDTVELRGERIRLHGIDAPESGQSCRASGEQWRCGQKASLALADQIGQSNITCRGSERDRYGRLIAVCWQGDTNLNAWMVRNGWALAYRRYSTDYVEEENTAKADGLGIWRGEFVPPWDWRRGERLSVSAASDSSFDPRGQDRDCGDFSTWQEAQSFYEAAGPGDPHRLDGDRDAVACEGLR